MTEFTDCCECLTEDKVQPQLQPQPTSSGGSELILLGILALGYMTIKG